MNIVLVADQCTSGFVASEKQADWMARYLIYLKTQGHQVTIITNGASDEHAENFESACIDDNIVIDCSPDNDTDAMNALEQADIVHLLSASPLCMQIKEAATGKCVPCIASIHSPQDIKRLRKKFYHNVAHIHCPSRYIAGELKKNKYKSRLHVVSNGADAVFRPMDIDKPKEWQNKFVIAMSGRLSPSNRQDTVIKAVNGSKYADQIQLVFLGDGPGLKLYQKLGRKIRSMPLFVSYNKEARAQLYNQCDLYINAKEKDVDGDACIEAFSCGLVPLISDSQANASGQFALSHRNLFNNKDAQDLKDKIEYMINHPQELIEIRGQYIARAAKYSASNCFSHLEYVYDQIATEKAYREKQAGSTEGHKIHLPQTMFYQVGEDFQFINRNALFVVFSFLFKYLLIFPVFYTVTKVVLGFKASGRKNLRDIKHGAVTVSNHVHILDAPMLSFAIFPKQPIMTSLKGNFETPGVSFLVRTLGATPIPETPKALRTFMNAMQDELDRKRLVHFYPEASLWPGYTKLRPFKNGAFHLAISSGMPVVPLVIKQRDPGRIHKLFKKKPCITVVIGRPVSPPEQGTQRQRIEQLRDTVHKAMQEMLEGSVSDSEKEATA